MSLQAGVILIGQTPRPDYEDYMRFHMPAGTIIHIRGALDSLTLEDIQALPTSPEEEILTTLARDGTQITVAARHIHQRIPVLIHELENLNVDFIVLLCTGEFPDFFSHVPILLPSRILTFNAAALSAGKIVSVVVPLQEQCTQMSKRWEAAGIIPVMHVLSPFNEHDSLQTLAEEIQATTPSLVVLDCMGYTNALKLTIQEVTQLPVIGARTLLGRLLEEITA